MVAKERAIVKQLDRCKTQCVEVGEGASTFELERHPRGAAIRMFNNYLLPTIELKRVRKYNKNWKVYF